MPAVKTKFIIKQIENIAVIFDTVCEEFYVEMCGEGVPSFSPVTKDIDSALKTFNVWVHGE
jgi:hypothetical protein